MQFAASGTACHAGCRPTAPGPPPRAVADGWNPAQAPHRDAVRNNTQWTARHESRAAGRWTALFDRRTAMSRGIDTRLPPGPHRRAQPANTSSGFARPPPGARSRRPERRPQRTKPRGSPDIWLDGAARAGSSHVTHCSGQPPNNYRRVLPPKLLLHAGELGRDLLGLRMAAVANYVFSADNHIANGAAFC